MSFIFQAILDRYNLPRELKPDKKVAWVASKYRDLMIKGEIVYFWLGGNPNIRGLYGWGIITADTPIQFGDMGYRIEVEYRCKFEKNKRDLHIPSETIQKNPTLKNHLIFRMPVGTNFPLSDEEDLALRAIIEQELGKEWLPPRPSLKR